MTEKPYTSHATRDATASEPFGVGVVQWTRAPGVGHRTELSSGFWYVNPEEASDPIDVEAHADETIYIIEGRLRIEPAESEPFELAAGGTASFNKGTKATWTVLEPTVEFFVYS